VNNLRRYLKAGRFAFVLWACLLWGGAAKADSIVDLGASVSDSGTADLVVADSTVSDGLSDWFFNPDPPQPFPAELNPSDPWTSDANIDTLNYWLSLVVELGEENDSSQLTPLYGSGTISSPDPNAPVIQVSQDNQTSPVNTQSLSQTSSEELVGSVPEPVTLWLFAGGLALLGLRRTRIAIIDHGPL
jgi:hypothetical protein